MKLKIHIVIILILLTWLNSATAYDFKHKGSMSEGKFKRYVPPLAQPYFNETPYITTEARLVYLYNEIPKGFVTGGGSINIFAAQIRLALTERLGLIATKDGYTILKFDSVLPDSDGFENISFGLKYALFQRPESEEIISFGIRYEPPTGSLSSGGINLQGIKRINEDKYFGALVYGTQVKPFHNVGRFCISGNKNYGNFFE